MKFNISFPETGQQKCIDIEDDKKVRLFYDRKMGEEIEGAALGDEFKGYVFRIAGGNDKQGFSMKQGVLVNKRVRLLLAAGHTNYRPKRTGERKRKSVRGCIVSHDIAVLHLVVIKKGANEIPGVTDDPRPRRLGPKRASKIRKLFSLDKGVNKKEKKAEERDDVRRYVVKREIKKEGKTARFRAPKIQRLITAERIRRKMKEKSEKKNRWTRAKEEAKKYNTLLNKVLHDRHVAEQKLKDAAKTS
jgi:small subunit ribosomal protein S6e